MTYNYEGPWSEIAGHNAPLYSPNLPDKRKWATKEPKFESVDSSVQAFLAVGVKPKKLIMGVAYYGRCLKGVAQGENYGLYEPHQGPGDAFTVMQPGTFDYAQLKGVPLSHTENDQHSHWTYCWDHISQVPYLYGKKLEN
jgi:chitinase